MNEILSKLQSPERNGRASQLGRSTRPMAFASRAFSSCFVLLLFLGGLSACTENSNSPAALAAYSRRLERTLADAALPGADRITADQRLIALVGADNSMRIQTLERIICQQTQSVQIKVYALKALAYSDPILVRQLLHHRLYKMEHWRVLISACKIAVELHDAMALNPLIRSLQRPARRFTIPHRPEALAIRQLSHKSLGTELWYRLERPGNMDARLAALAVLYQLEGPVAVKRRILTTVLAVPGDAMVADLQWYARLFGSLPHRPTEVAWVEQLRRSPLPRMIRLAEKHLQYISRLAAMPQGIPPRYVALLAMLGNPSDYPPRSVLLTQVVRLLAQHRHIRRPVPYAGAPTDINPSLSANRRRLSYCDLLLARLFLQAMDRPLFVQSVWTLGNQSRHNTHTEEGGLILPVLPSSTLASTPGNLPEIRLKLYSPEIQFNNTIYVSSPRLLLATPHGLAQFIFHFQHLYNARYTGPAAGDLRYVRRMGCSVVIFTSIGRNLFDTVLDTPSGAVLDLGLVRLPHIQS